MSGLLGSPDIPAPKPIIDHAAMQAAGDAERRRSQRGRSSAMRTGGSGDTSAANVGTKILLGG